MLVFTHRAAQSASRAVAGCLIIALVGLTLSGCSLVRNDQGVVRPPGSDVTALVAGSSNALAFDLMHRLAVSPSGSAAGNTILAPLSISALLALLLEGAEGETAEAIADVLHLPGVPSDTAAFGSLLRYITHSKADVELAVANAVWPNIGYPLQEAFVETLRTAYEAEVSELDLGSVEGAQTIDDWVKGHTRGRIEKMSDALRLPDPAVVTVLMNAVYFKGSWTSQFDPDLTQPGPFLLPDGTELTVPMMSQRGEFALAYVADGPEGSVEPGFTMVRLPYGEDKRFVMEILLPDPGYGVAEFVSDLDPEVRESAAASLAEQEIFLVLPRFELEYEVGGQLDATLQHLGMGIAYSPESDFTGMSPNDPWLSRVAHKTYIRVDEEGSEAAGVTGGAMVESIPAELRVDRPFVFTITDTETGIILFMGLVADPTA